MKRNQIMGLILSVFVFIFTGCEEVGPYINFEEEEPVNPIEEVIPPPEETNQQKVVLLEEFTGVRCPNCPAGSELAEELASQYEGQVIIVSIHSGVFSIPYPNAENFKSADGIEIENLLGKAAAYPSAAINRKLFEGENRPIIPSTKWNNYIKAELDEPALAYLNLNTVNYETGNLQLTTSVQFFEKLESTIKLSVMLIEDDIVSPQDVDGTKVDNYVHKHVLRAMLSPFNGTLIGLSANPDSTYQNSFTFNEFASNWDENNMSIVAFLHGSGNDLSVLQATTVPLIE